MEISGYVAAFGGAVLMGGLLLNDPVIAWSGLAFFAVPCVVSGIVTGLRARRGL
jgi:hypothetical protein